MEISIKRSNFIFDRCYDDNKIIDYVDKNNNNFVIQTDDKRVFLFKVKKKNCHEEAIKIKRKRKIEFWFDDNEMQDKKENLKDIYIRLTNYNLKL